MQLATTVIGAGSVGLGVAASLAVAGQRVTLLTRADSVAALASSDITVSGLHGEHRLPAGTIAIADARRPPDAARACDMLVVTTKTYDLAAALQPFAEDGPRPSAVLAMQNGLGASETIRQAMGPAIPVYASAMMIGLERQGLGHVAIKAAASPILVGPLLGDDGAPLERFVAAAQPGFLPVKSDPRIRDTILFKLLFNTCMNPTGALTGLTYGELVTNPHTLGLIVRLADETLAVLAASDGYRPAASGAAYARDTLAPAVLARSSAHRSSMLQDIAAGRRTEIDSLNGAVARLGVEHAIPTPTHDALIALISARTPNAR